MHLIHAELFKELADKGFSDAAGDLGENVVTSGLDVLALPTNTRLQFPSGAILEITGLRNPCHQINGHTAVLMQAVLDTAADGSLIRKCGVMAIVIMGGVVAVGDAIDVLLPTKPWQQLLPV